MNFHDGLLSARAAYLNAHESAQNTHSIIMYPSEFFGY